MKYLLSLFVLLALTAPAGAGDIVCDPHSEGGWAECRFKLSIGWPAVKAGSMVRPEADAGWRDGLSFSAYYHNYVNEYLRANGAITTHSFYDDLVVGPFRGRTGDVYRAWARSELESYEVQGQGMTASLEYRMIGNLWGALSFQSSPETVARVREAGEDFLVDYVTPYQTSTGPVTDFTWVSVTRHRVEYEREHKRKLFQFAGLLKYDLMRRNRYWSVLPQLGVDVLMLRENEYTVQTRSQAPLYRNGYARELSLEHESQKTTEVRQYRTRIRPVTGLTLEFFPLGGKWGDGGLAIVLDGRFYPCGNDAFTSEQGVLLPYTVDTKLRHTLTLNVVALF